MNNVVLRLGDRGDDVTRLQELLISADVLSGKADGIFGPGTNRAVRAFQASEGEIVDGIVGRNTWIALQQAHKDNQRLTEEDLKAAADELRCDVNTIKAISEVESSGAGFIDPNHPKILFERHLMHRFLKKRDLPTAIQLGETHLPNIVNKRTGGYYGGKKEYERFSLAYGLHHETAIEATSWGRYQILGMHWKRLGYASAEEMLSSMKKNENEHLKAFVQFIKTDRRLSIAVKERDWTNFARTYNGPNFAKNSYDEKMKAAYERLLNT